MKLKTATLLAIIALVFLFIPSCTYFLFNWGILEFNIDRYNIINKILNLFSFLGTICLFPFFISLYKKQK